MGHVERVYEYHIAKAGHTLLIASLNCMVGVPLEWAIGLALVLYLVVGKFGKGSNWRDWIADGLIGSFAFPAAFALAGRAIDALVGFGVLAFWYWVLVLRLRWARP